MVNSRLTAAFPSRIPAIGFAAAAAIWLLLVVVSPYLVSHSAPHSVFLRTGGVVYLAGRVLCHQRAERSFHAWGVQLPVCGRCVGLYTGAAFGSLFASWWPARRHLRRRSETGEVRAATSDFGSRTGDGGVWLVRFTIAVIPTATSLGLEVVGVWAQTPAVRSVAAVPLGFAVAWFVGEHAADVLRPLRKVWRV